MPQFQFKPIDLRALCAFLFLVALVVTVILLVVGGHQTDASITALLTIALAVGGK